MFSNLSDGFCSSSTSVTVVLRKVSVLYVQPCPHGTRWLLLSSCGTPLEEEEEKQLESDRLKFGLRVDWLTLLSLQRYGGVAPVKMLTIMWKASSTCGKQIQMYKTFWYLPKPPMEDRIWSKFIAAALFQRMRIKMKNEEEEEEGGWL